MNRKNRGLSLIVQWLAAISLMVLGGGMSAHAGLFGLGGTSWQEEVLLHDGRTIVVERTQTYGGRNEPGQPEPIREHSISFTLPSQNKSVTWTSEYGEDIGRTNFDLLAVHVLNDTPYLVTTPNLCLSYNKWGRPNPPYVFFKHDGDTWQRIPLSEFPAEFKTINVALDIRGQGVENLEKLGRVSAEQIKALNAHVKQPHYKTIVREPYPTVEGKYVEGCPEMIRTKSGWDGLGFFRSKPTYEMCVEYCSRRGVSPQDCPCARLFKEE